MPTNPNLIVSRFNEIAATACAEQTLHQLHSLACAPSGKVYARQREQRLALWKQLREVAEAQVAALSVAPVARKRPAKPTVVPSCPASRQTYEREVAESALRAQATNPTPVAEAAVKE